MTPRVKWMRPDYEASTVRGHGWVQAETPSGRIQSAVKPAHSKALRARCSITRPRPFRQVML